MSPAHILAAEASVLVVAIGAAAAILVALINLFAVIVTHWSVFGNTFTRFIRYTAIALSVLLISAFALRVGGALNYPRQRSVSTGTPATSSTSSTTARTSNSSTTDEVPAPASPLTTAPIARAACPTSEYFDRVRADVGGKGFAINGQAPPPSKSLIVLQSTMRSVGPPDSVLVLTLCASTEGVWYFSRFRSHPDYQDPKKVGLVSKAAPLPDGSGYQISNDFGSGPVTYTFNRLGITVSGSKSPVLVFTDPKVICLEAPPVESRLAAHLSSSRPPRCTPDAIIPWAPVP